MTENDYPMFKDRFYKDLFDTSAKIHFCELDNAEEICRQILWNNSLTMVNVKCILYVKWLAQGIVHMQDIINAQGKIMPKQEIAKNYKLNSCRLTYESLISTIKNKWKSQ